jgi:hypothetical protein
VVAGHDVLLAAFVVPLLPGFAVTGHMRPGEVADFCGF